MATFTFDATTVIDGTLAYGDTIVSKDGVGVVEVLGEFLGHVDIRDRRKPVALSTLVRWARITEADVYRQTSDSTPLALVNLSGEATLVMLTDDGPVSLTSRRMAIVEYLEARC